MNPRIRELWKQCKTYDWNLNRPTYTYDHEKFAELIVKECIDIVSPYALKMENFDGGHPITDLKKHFGINNN